MFVGREKELLDLNKRYQSGKFEFAVIYGRRRVGKTTLINEFVKDKESIIYSATETNSKKNLVDLSKSIYALSPDYENTSGMFLDFQTAFEAVFQIAQKRRLVFVIDEYPYLASCAEGIASIFQILIDRYHQESKLFLILCGSSMSFMENQVMGYKSPLYGRRTCQYKIKPFDFFETKNYFKNADGEDLAILYGITGGIPLYMSMMDEKLTIEENIKNNFLTSSAYLYEEPMNLIKQECRDASQYNTIIGAIAQGASRLSEICSKTGIDTALASSYLNKLSGLGIVKKEIPFGLSSSKKSIYVLEDFMFRFWYRFVQDNISAINRGMEDQVFLRIAPHLSDYMGGVFEEICKQYLWKLLLEGKAAINFMDVGRWWGTDAKTKQQTEIDIMGVEDKETALFGECKWKNEKTDLQVLEKLITRSKLFPYTKNHFYLFSKSGFTKGCLEKGEEMGNVTFVTYKEMLE
ncbi:MAG: ATP-binding protein [Lachnospiraceae bacterium]|nr:ATP-binding protein [Lachnospiraceae bacterium]